YFVDRTSARRTKVCVREPHREHAGRVDLVRELQHGAEFRLEVAVDGGEDTPEANAARGQEQVLDRDRKSTRLNSSHVKISYAVHRDLHSFPTTTLFRSLLRRQDVGASDQSLRPGTP